MQIDEIASALSALAHETRLKIMAAIAQHGQSGIRSGEIGERLKMSSASLAFHLNQLRHANLVTTRRQSRLIIYSAQTHTMQSLLDYLMNHCSVADTEDTQQSRRFNVLFLCTNNSARSIMAECLTNRLGSGRFRAFSAGSHPIGKIQPNALRVLRESGCATEALRSKNWNEFSQPDSPSLDFVFTLCDRANAEVCPTWPGQPVRAHWSIQDPVSAARSGTEAFRKAYRDIEQRVRIFTALPIESLERFALERWVHEIGNLSLAA
ncbi:MAG TPA: metalloregulator ArsR/SmtB family transcription factor [Candidatus Binataceae bacterium]|nr:metalloregulator ArsR/SmtB family transcription factor [Candidatus Binataceae bacterium]